MINLKQWPKQRWCKLLSFKMTNISDICDPTWVNEADVIRGPNCDFAFSVKNQVWQKSFWYHFPFQRYEKNKLDMLAFYEFKIPCCKLKVSICSRQVNEPSKQHSMKTTKVSSHAFTPLKIFILKNMCQRSFENIMKNLTNFDLVTHLST